MEWLNYHHLLYFWTVAREGSIAKASVTLRLAQPTISAQIATLERSLGEKLFTRAGRGLVLTDTGRVVLGYADQIFNLGRELLSAVRTPEADRPLVLVVGIADHVPKLIAYRLLEPVLHMRMPVRLVCREDRPERLLAELAVHGVDVVLSDAPTGPGSRVRAFNHELGASPTGLFAVPRLASALRRRFPAALHSAPFLLPRESSAIRGPLERWLEDHEIRPNVVGEFDDSALLKIFGQAGAGVFPAPTVIAPELRRQYGAQLVGTIDSVQERFYAIVLERRLMHPAVVAIREAARERLFRPRG